MRTRARGAGSRARSVAAALAIVLAVPYSARATATPALRLAVLELRDAAGLSPDEAGYLTDRARGGASRELPSSRVLVLTRESLEPLLPAGMTLAECASGSCEVEIGRRAGADYVMSGEVLRFGGELRLLLKLHHCNTAAFLGSESVAGGDVAALERGLDGGTSRLCALLRQHAGIVVAPAADTLQRHEPALREAPVTNPRDRAAHGDDSMARTPRTPADSGSDTERGPAQREARVPAVTHTSATLDTAIVGHDEFMWTARDNGRDIDWHEAWRYCEACREGGARDWRLPTIEELETLREFERDAAPRTAIDRDFRRSAAAIWSVSMARAGVALRYDFVRDQRTRAPFAERRGARVLCVRRNAD